MTPLPPLLAPLNSIPSTENKLTIYLTGDYRTWTYKTSTNDKCDVYARRTVQLGPEGTITLYILPSEEYLTLPIDQLSDECQEWVKETDRIAAAQRSEPEAVQTATPRLTPRPAPKRFSAARTGANRVSRREMMPNIHLSRKTRTMRFALWANGRKVERWVTVSNGWAPVIDLTGDDESERDAVVDQAEILFLAMEIGD